MAGENSAEKACGQVLICLKLSNLNYMVKETPFSAYVTIRKKFMKSFNPENHTPVVGDSFKKLERNKEVLEKKNKGLLTDIAQYKFDLEEFEVKVNALEKINAELELKLEKTDDIYESLKKDFARVVESNKELKNESSKTYNENKQIKLEKKDLESQLKDKNDFVFMLESTVSNKESKIIELSEELDSLKKMQFSCIFCEYKFETEENLKTHVRRFHEHKCTRCDLAFKDKDKLKDHTCKLNVRNPSQGNCYMKNWILADGCFPIINKATMEEVGTLHCDNCWRKISPCFELKPLDQHDKNGVYHGKVNRFVRNGVVNWSDLMTSLH